MNRTTIFLFLITSLAIGAITVEAKPPKSKSKETQTTQATTPTALAESANGWTYVKGEWIHPDGYKFVNGKVLRTTAKTGKAFPKPPGKLALENAQKLTPKSNPAPAKSAAEKAAEERRKNLTPIAAPQTGTHM
jgi:hypothetical protein